MCCQCQGNACFVLIFSSSNDGALPLRILYWLIFLCFNATFSNISVISWRPVLVVEEAAVPGDNGKATGKFNHLKLRVECTLFCNVQSRARSHAVLLIGLNELLGKIYTVVKIHDHTLSHKVVSSTPLTCHQSSHTLSDDQVTWRSIDIFYI